MGTAGNTLLAAQLRLGQSEWALWNQVLLRSAGFPYDWVNKFSDAALAEAADAVTAHPNDHDFLTQEPFASHWLAHSKAKSAALTDIAAEPLFRLALTWQNRHFIDTGLAPLLRQIADPNSRERKRRPREQAVTSYWRRYCTKCETIGFFGPTAWATVSSAEPGLHVQHGPLLVDRAEVSFECWPIVELAKHLDGQVDLRPWIPPRRAPYLRAGAGQVVLPSGRSEPADPLTLACLRHADGRTLLPGLIGSVSRECPEATEGQIRRQLEALHQRGWLIWRFELRPTAYPESELRALLVQSMDDGPGRPVADVLGALDQLVAARDQAAREWDSADELGPALTALESAFTAATGHRGVRNEGLSYAGRTLTYLDCGRDLRVRVGTQVIEAMEPIGFVLDSVRWTLGQVADGLTEFLRAGYRRLIGRGHPVPNAAMLWLECLPQLEATLRGIVTRAVATAQSRWEAILPMPAGACRVSFRSPEIRAQVRESFEAAPAAWTAARWCSPDVMIAAASAAAIPAGDFQLVLGEIHSAINTVDYAATVRFHPDPAELAACLDQDHPGPRLLVAPPREARPRLTTRSHSVLARDHDYQLMLTPQAPVPARGIVCAGADVDVVEDGSRLVLVLPDGARFDALDLFTEPLKAATAQSFALHPPSRHRPRVTIDRVVVAREGWTFPVAELAFADLPAEPPRFVCARRWARENGVPDRVFVKSPLEVKPFYVDFAAPAYVDGLLAAVRKLRREEPSGSIRLTEMLPDGDETWLSDALGRRYVAELRFVAFDTRTAQP
jgi:Lantibiotic dehydratase, N terminus